jgi:hypothetical protein
MKFSFERGQSKLSGERGNCKLKSSQKIFHGDSQLRAARKKTSRKIGFDIAAKVRQSVEELTAKFPLPY